VVFYSKATKLKKIFNQKIQQYFYIFF